MVRYSFSMPLGQLEFIKDPTWKSTLGTSSYVVVKPLDTTSPTAKYNAIYLGTTATPVATTLGTFDRLNDGINACQAHYSAL